MRISKQSQRPDESETRRKTYLHEKWLVSVKGYLEDMANMRIVSGRANPPIHGKCHGSPRHLPQQFPRQSAVICCNGIATSIDCDFLAVTVVATAIQGHFHDKQRDAAWTTGRHRIRACQSPTGKSMYN